jgi:hypothetical protein
LVEEEISTCEEKTDTTVRTPPKQEIAMTFGA